VKSIDRLPAAAPKDSGAPSPDRPDRPLSANGVSIVSAGASAGASAAFRSPAPASTNEAAPAITSNGQLERSSAPRREVLIAMRVLHEMPPFAREREIEHGRYSHFSPEEREMLRNAER
jgi:hypothetical protein